MIARLQVTGNSEMVDEK